MTLSLCRMAWLCALLVSPVLGTATELNLYSARKESLIRPLLDQFTRQTGITVNILSTEGASLLKRLHVEAQRSPADVLLTVDLGQLTRALDAGLLQAVQSDVLEQRIPPEYRDAAGHWYGLSLRARVIIYDRTMQGAPPADYLQLAEPGRRLCMRSSNNVYNQSLVAALLGRYGQERTSTWLQGLVANFARPPQGGDRDQIRAVAAGVCDLAVVNSYYLGAMLNASIDRDVRAARSVALQWPEQGVHINLAGAAVVRYAPHVEAATALLEFLVGDAAQRWLTEQNFEYPVVQHIAPAATLQAWGPFVPDTKALATLGQYQAPALLLMDYAGWR